MANLRQSITATVGDYNNDGHPDVLGALNVNGTLVGQNLASIGLGDLTANGRVYRDAVFADFNGDGLLDLVANTYSSANDPNSVALLFFNNGNGTFREDPNFTALNLRGHGETIVVADFNNDGAPDIFLPYYTFSYPPGSTETNSQQCYLLINDGSGHFHDVATSAGVALPNIPLGHQPEGAQAVDYNNDGFIDLYTAGYLFRNNGNLTFTNVSPQVGLPTDQLFDEGAKFLDWNNDGWLDLVSLNPATGPHLYQFNGSTFTAETTTAAGNPFFSTGAPNYASLSYLDNFGINTYDLNNDGREDLVVQGGDNSDPMIFMNTGSGFELAPPETGPGSFQGLGNGDGSAGFADFNGDGKIDMLYSNESGLHYFENTTTMAPTSGAFTLEILGPNGERNQYGRVARITTPGLGTMTRVVDGGSGYMAEDQYPILVGTPYTGLQTVDVLFPSATPGGSPVTVQFTIEAGQDAQVFAPSAAFPMGRVVINASATPAPTFPPAALPLASIGVYRPSNNTFYLRNNNSSGTPDLSVANVGATTNDIPIAGNWLGTGTTTIGYYRPSTSTFYLKDSNTTGQAAIVIPFGSAGDVPVVGDWTGGSFTQIGTYTPSTQTFHLNSSNLPSSSDDDGSGPTVWNVAFGNPGDVPVAGDWNGDGITTIGVYRPSEGAFYLRNSNTAGPADLVINNLGAQAGDVPVVGDWDANGTTGIGYYRPSTGTFYLWNTLQSGSAPAYVITYGNNGDLPIAGDWTGTRITVSPPAPTATAIPVPDASFESVSVGTGSSAYRYNPSGSAWTFDGGSGLSANGTSFTRGNPPAPDGSQVAFLQTLGTFQQTLSLAAGSYSLSFSAAQPELRGQPQRRNVPSAHRRHGRRQLRPHQLHLRHLHHHQRFALRGQHTILFKGTNLNGGDNTAFIDQVQLFSLPLPSSGLPDSSFESVHLGIGATAYQYNPSGSAWTFDGGSGLAGNGSSFTYGNPPAPDGSQVAFLATLGTFRQTVSLAAGSYSLSFSAAQRQNQQGSPHGQTFQVLIDGVVVGSFDPTSFTYATYTTSSVSLLAGWHTILFKGTNLYSGDNTAFIDQVQINLVAPPPPYDGSFESVSVGTGLSAYRYNPSGSAWTFDGGSGLSANGTSFTYGNPSAPDGGQVAFLQTLGTFRQTVSLAAGSYSLSFSAAQRRTTRPAPTAKRSRCSSTARSSAPLTRPASPTPPSPPRRFRSRPACTRSSSRAPTSTAATIPPSSTKCSSSPCPCSPTAVSRVCP